MDKDEVVAEYLKNKYKPSAILLHGSRAIGKDRPNSDWDIIMLNANTSNKGLRENIKGENVEWKVFKLPVKLEEIINTFGLYLQFAKVLWEKDEIGTKLLKESSKEYAKGPNLSKDYIQREKQFFNHKILSLKDDRRVSYMFFRHLCVVFNLANKLWFEVVRNKYSKPYYLAFPEIEKKDPEYYKRLLTLCSNSVSNDEKIASAEWISKKIFNKKK